MKTRTALTLAASLTLTLITISLAYARVASDSGTIQQVLSPGTATWESVEVRHPNVMYDEGIYKIWYAGSTARNYSGSRGIGYAISTDRITWENRQQIHGVSGYAQVDSPNVIKEGSIYKMWFRQYYESIGGEWFTIDGQVMT